MSGEPLGVFKTSLGVVEPNVVLAGLEAVAASWIAWVVITDRDLIPTMTAGWSWIFPVWGIFVLLGIVLLGLIVEGVAGFFERVITWEDRKTPGKAKKRWSELLHEPPSDAWNGAQRWIWESPQASDEFARRRLRLLLARNSILVFVLFTLFVGIGLPIAKPSDVELRWLIAVPTGLLCSWLFYWVWIAAQQGYNRAIQDAGRISPS